MTWSRCPACGCITWDAARHAAHERALAAALASLALPVTEATPDERWPDATPVPGPGLIPESEVDRAALLREAADAAREAITADALPALDAYLDVDPPRLPTVGEYRALVLVVRGLAVAARTIIRLAARRLDSTEG